MRGGALSDPTVVGLLEPFIVTSWYGHRDSEMPDVVRQEMNDRRWHGPGESNVFYLIIDSNGRLVYAFDALPRRGRGPGGGQNEKLREELRYAIDKLGVRTRGRKRPALELPDFEKEGSRTGVRIFVQLKDDRMRAYRAPVVELVQLSTRAQKALEYSKQKKEIPAEILKNLLAQVYPPGIMERTDQRTKRVYDISKVEGTLTLEPAGSRKNNRFALLQGRVHLTDSGGDGFSYTGDFECVLVYRSSSKQLRFLRGTFEGIYPRQTRTDGTRRIELVAAFESRPK